MVKADANGDSPATDLELEKSPLLCGTSAHSVPQSVGDVFMVVMAIVLLFITSSHRLGFRGKDGFHLLSSF